MTLTNTGATCLYTGYGAMWQVYRDGTWSEIALNRPVPAAIRLVDPGATFVHEFAVPEDASPGRYRVVKRIDGGGPAIDVAAEVTITA